MRLHLSQLMMVKLLADHGQYCRILALISALLFSDSNLIKVSYLTDNTALQVPTMKLLMFNRRSLAWITATFVLTPITAYYLAIAGYILMTPVDAAINGFLFSIVYVGFRVLQVYRIVKLRSKTYVTE